MVFKARAKEHVEEYERNREVDRLIIVAFKHREKWPRLPLKIHVREFWTV